MPKKQATCRGYCTLRKDITSGRYKSQISTFIAYIRTFNANILTFGANIRTFPRYQREIRKPTRGFYNVISRQTK